MVDTLLQIASMDSLQPHFPVGVWVLLKKLPSLPSFCMGRFLGTTECVVRRVRDLGDVEILKSYFLLVWSEWDILHSGGLPVVRGSIREDFSGIGMGRHREDLIERLDHVLGQLDEGSGHSLQPQRIKREYKELKEILLEVDQEATDVLTCTPSDLLTPVGTHRVALDIHLCAPAPVPIVACLQHSLFAPQPHSSIVHGFASVAPSSIIAGLFEPTYSPGCPLLINLPPPFAKPTRHAPRGLAPPLLSSQPTPIPIGRRSSPPSPRSVFICPSR